MTCLLPRGSLPCPAIQEVVAGTLSLWPLSQQQEEEQQHQQMASGNSRVAVSPPSDLIFSLSQPSDLLLQIFARCLPLIFQSDMVQGSPNALTSLHIDVEDVDEGFFIVIGFWSMSLGFF
ncbi:unnamed protein product [Polarella glacialis]|uniref:Uncharacterized protein n=1 Tax=Polarella glacialis TaxID=89957 RepID=A0A813IAJ7_POLGL|nr:unnamed protein product [Polarella glacialis]